MVLFPYLPLQLSVLFNCIPMRFCTAQTLKYAVTIAAYTNISVLMNKKLFHFSAPALRPHALVPSWKHFWGAAPFYVGHLLQHAWNENSWTSTRKQINAHKFFSAEVIWKEWNDGAPTLDELLRMPMYFPFLFGDNNTFKRKRDTAKKLHVYFGPV